MADRQDFFGIFGLEETLTIDPADLQKRFYERSRKFHPDLFARKSERERNQALESTAILNDAYRTLRDPVKRAEYVLTKHGFDMAEQRSANVPPELLEEVFELNEAMEEMRTGDESARPQLQEARGKFAGMLDEIDSDLEKEFAGSRLPEIRGLLNRRRYIENLLRDVDKELATDGHPTN